MLDRMINVPSYPFPFLHDISRSRKIRSKETGRQGGVFAIIFQSYDDKWYLCTNFHYIPLIIILFIFINSFIYAWLKDYYSVKVFATPILYEKISTGNLFPVSKNRRMNNKIDTEITLFRRVSSIPSVSRISHGSSNWVRFRRRSAGQDTHPVHIYEAMGWFEREAAKRSTRLRIFTDEMQWPVSVDRVQVCTHPVAPTFFGTTLGKEGTDALWFRIKFQDYRCIALKAR